VLAGAILDLLRHGAAQSGLGPPLEEGGLGLPRRSRGEQKVLKARVKSISSLLSWVLLAPNVNGVS